MALALGRVSFEEIADSQCDVVALRDVIAAGVTPAQIRWRVTSGHWQRPMRDVLLLNPDPPSRLQLLWCAVESVGPDAYLAGATAATLGGLRGHDSTAITVVVATGRRIAPREGLAIRRTARLAAVDTVRDDLPRRTRPARSLIDMAEWAPGRDEARALLAAAVQQRLVTPEQLRAALVRRGPITRRTLVADTVDELEAAADAVVDVLYARMEAQFGLPAGRRQLTTAFGGAARRLDVYYDRWHVRVQVHNGPAVDTDGDLPAGPATQVDRHPDVAGRQVVLRFPTRLLREAPEFVASQVRAALRDHGRPG
jgi:hypothetical protein